MTAHEIRPTQLRALLLLLVLVPLIPAALMVRFMLESLRVERLAALDRLQQFHSETIATALRKIPPAPQPAEPAAADHLLDAVKGLGSDDITARVIDAAGHYLAGEPVPWGAPLVQITPPMMPGATIQIFLAGPEVLDEAIADQRRILLLTGVSTILAAVIIAGLAALAVNRQLAIRELKNTSVATVAHELRTPLASMRMLVDTLREGRYRSETQMREYLDLVAAENERLTRLTETFLSFSRLNRQGPALQYAQIETRKVVERAITPLRPRLEASDCSFKVEIDPGLPPIEADQDALAQVLTNLLENALKYSNPPRQVGLHVSKEGKHVAFAVRDNGIGIPEDERRAIFKPFYQVDSKLSRTRECCGLGLAIVQQLVKAQGGSIEVASTPGKGSVFTVRLPSA
jgi:signal transduction histidine kinase